MAALPEPQPVTADPHRRPRAAARAVADARPRRTPRARLRPSPRCGARPARRPPSPRPSPSGSRSRASASWPTTAGDRGRPSGSSSSAPCTATSRPGDGSSPSCARWGCRPTSTCGWCPNLNPDGEREEPAYQRPNGVDLNRNFPHVWVNADKGTRKYSGPKAAQRARDAGPHGSRQAGEAADDHRLPPAAARRRLLPRQVHAPGPRALPRDRPADPAVRRAAASAMGRSPAGTTGAPRAGR